MPTPTASLKGIATIIWGTDGRLNGVSGAIVESLQITPKNSAPIEIEDNAGFTAVEVVLADGFNAKASCVFDTAKTWPLEGANTVLTLPNMAGGASNVAYTCLVGSLPELALGRKKEGMITFNLTYRPGCAV